MGLTVDFSTDKVNSLKELFDLVKDEKFKKAMIQAAVDQYRELRDEKSELLDRTDDFETEKNNVESKIDSVKDLSDVVKRIDAELEKYSDLISDSNLEDKVQSLKEDRITRLVKLLASFSNRFLQNGSGHLNISAGEMQRVKGWFMVASAFSILSGGFVLYIAGNSQAILLLSVAIALSQFILFLLFNVFDDVILTSDKLFSTQYIEGGSKIFEQYMGSSDDSENMLFVRKAWLSALRQEKERIMSIINSQVEGGDINKLTTSIKQKDKEAHDTQTRLNEIANIMMSAQDYLAIRRELDVMTINSSEEPTNLGSVTFKNVNSLDESPRQSIMKYIEFLKQQGTLSVYVS